MKRSPRQGALGRRIAEIRAERGLSLRDLAALSRIPHSSLHDLESGATTIAPADRVAELARVLRVAPSSLLSLAVADARRVRGAIRASSARKKTATASKQRMSTTGQRGRS